MKLEISKLKLLLGIQAEDASKDAILGFLLDDVEEMILNYCHINKLPSGLKNTAYRMAMDIYTHSGLKTAQGGNTAVTGAVSSLNEGDVSVSFSTSAADTAANSYYASVLADYSCQLQRYRKLVWK